MNDFEQRKQDILQNIARQASMKPLLATGFWFHDDIRHNFYYAAYLFAAAVQGIRLPEGKEEAIKTAEAVLLKVLALQDKQAVSSTYGHWPMNLGDRPKEAMPHILPAEIMGCLLAAFYKKYRDDLSDALRSAAYEALVHLHQSRYYEEPLHRYNHHEAKHTAAGIIYGTMLGDKELLKNSHRRVQATLYQLQTYSMTEYGILPWFWHWVQAFEAAWEIAEDADIKQDIEGLLEWLWQERAAYYLKGAWAGPHSRSLPLDAPSDLNIAFDYTQFGDFELPEELPKAEFAALLDYEVPEELRMSLSERIYPLELTRLYPASIEELDVKLQCYLYMTEQYAVGGILERRAEFDNEQHRWDITLPIRRDSINQAFFLHPAEGRSGADPRHSSDAEDIFIQQNAVIALYKPEVGNEQAIAGVLPLGKWHEEGNSLYGQVDNVFFAVHLMKPFTTLRKSDRYMVEAVSGGVNGVVMEVVSLIEAAREGIDSLTSFIEASSKRVPVFNDEVLSAEYESFLGNAFSFTHRAAQGELAMPSSDGEAHVIPEKYGESMTT